MTHTTTAPRRTRTRKPTVPLPLDQQVVETLRKYGPQDPLSLLSRLRGEVAGSVVDSACRLVTSRRIRVDERGRFALPEVAA